GGPAGGMMGAGGAGRGQGAEDKDHQRRYGLDTELDVDLHVKDEHGERMIDPVTGMPVVPPVIGE
ncbi:MAG: hypothetical protein ACRDQ7_18765, partial [Haloechinothrix sp.]